MLQYIACFEGVKAMIKNKSKKLFIILLLVVVTVLCITGIIPSMIGRVSATEYVKSNYHNMGLEFVKMEYSPAHGDYFAVFKDSKDKIYNFLMTSKYLPIGILYDPLNPPG